MTRARGTNNFPKCSSSSPNLSPLSDTAKGPLQLPDSVRSPNFSPTPPPTTTTRTTSSFIGCLASDQPKGRWEVLPGQFGKFTSPRQKRTFLSPPKMGGAQAGERGGEPISSCRRKRSSVCLKVWCPHPVSIHSIYLGIPHA